MQPNLQRIADTCTRKIRTEQLLLATLKRLAKKWPALVNAPAHLVQPVAEGKKCALYVDSVTPDELAALLATFKPLPLFWHADNLNGHGPRTTAEPLSVWDTVTPIEPFWVEVRPNEPNEFNVRWTAREVEFRASVPRQITSDFSPFRRQEFYGGYTYYYTALNERTSDYRAVIFDENNPMHEYL